MICDPTLFPGKIAQTLQIVFFLERGEEIEPWFWHIWIAQWLKLFPTTAYYFRFRPSSEGKGWSKLDERCKLWVRLLFIKTWILLIFFKQCFCFLEYYLWWNLPKRAVSRMLNRYAKLWKFLIDNHKCYSCETYHDYVSL